MSHPLLNEPKDESKMHPLLRSPKIYGIGTSGYINPQVQGLDKLERYTPYNVQLSPFLDLNEQRAQNQSTAEKWKNGAAKMFTTAGGAFVEGTAGLVAGIIESTKQRDFTSFYDNSVGRSVDRYKERIRDQFPNYYTQQELKSEGWASMGYANFWADKVLDGVGYMMGTIASTYATAGMGRLVGGVASNALKAYRVTKAIDTAEDIARITNASIKLSKGLDAAGQASIGLMSSFAESSMEARQILNDETKKLKSKYAAELGISEYDLPKDVLAKIKDEASAAANIGFVLNSVVTGANNLLIFRNAMLPGFRSAKANSNNFKFNVKTNQWEDVWSSMNKADKFITRFGKPMLESGVSEAFQEGTQNVISDKAGEFATAGSVSDLFESLSEGYGSLFNTKEGKESMLVGAIVGMLSAGAGGLRRTLSSSMNEAEKTRNQNILAVINNPDLFNFVRKGQQVQSNIDLSAEMQRALQDGDHKKYRDIQAELLLGETLFHLENGTMDLFLEQIEDEILKDDAEFAEHYGIPESTTFNKKEHLAKIQDRVKKLAELKEKIDVRFPAPRQLDKKQLEKLSDEEKLDYMYAQNEHKIFTSTILRNNFRIEDADSRLENMSIEINNLAGKSVLTPKDALLKPVDETSPTKRVLFTSPVELPSGEVIIQSDEQWEKLSKKLFDAYEELKEENPQKAEDFIELARDVMRLGESRAESVYALNNLLTDPKKRESYLAREKQKEDVEAKRQRDALAKEKLNNAKNSDEVQSILNNQSPGNELSEEFKIEAAKKQSELRLKENELEEQSLALSLDELKSRRDNTEDEVEKSMLNNIIQRRQRAGEFDAPRPVTQPTVQSTVEPPTQPDVEAEEEVAEMVDATYEYNVSSEIDKLVPVSEYEEGYDEEFNPPDQVDVSQETEEYIAEQEGEEEIKTDSSEDIFEKDELSDVNILNMADVQEQVPTTKEEDSNPVEDNLPEVVSSEESKQTNDRTRVPENQISINNGEINVLRKKDENGNYNYNALVSLDNTLTPGFDKNHIDPTGTPYNINRAFIKTTPKEEVLAGSITLKLIETQWSKEQKELGTLNETNIPIGVYLTTENSNGEVLVGLLPITTPNRKAIVDDLMANKTISGTVTKIVASAPINTVDVNNQPVYFGVKDIIEDLSGQFEFGVAETRGDGTQKVTFGKNNELIDPDFLEQASFLQTKVSPGRVVLVSNKPGDALGVLPLTTASMDGKATQRVLDLIKEDSNDVVDLVKSVVGTKTSLDPKSVFSIEKTNAKKVNGFVYFPSITGEIIKASTTALSKAIRGEPYRISIGEVVPWTEENAEGEENVLLNGLGEPKFIFRSTLPQAKTEDPEAKKAFAIEQGKMINQKYKPTLLNDLEAAIKKNRRQVDLNRLKTAKEQRPFTSPVTNITYPNYIEYLSSDKELEQPQGVVKSILSTNSKAYNGSMYADVGLNISIFEDVLPEEVKIPNKVDIVNPNVAPIVPSGPSIIDGIDFNVDDIDLFSGDNSLGDDIKKHCNNGN